MACKTRPLTQVAAVVAIAVCLFVGAAHQAVSPYAARGEKTVVGFGARGDGKTDDTQAIQRAIDAAVGNVRFPRGVYLITEPLLIDLEKTGYTSISGDGVAQVVMAGPGPAIRFVGTHAGTAAPHTVQNAVWDRQRTPMVDGVEIVGRHAEADGIEARGTMQLTITRVTVRHARHGIHLVDRNRNVLISECHLYDNSGIGVFLDRLNLHQINIANCHISYNDGGGVVARGSEIRNLQIGTCDIEGNMGGPDSAPTANVLLDSEGRSIGEVAIVGCTIQHAHDAPQSANIRINGRSSSRPFTDEVRHGNITIANNVLSDVQVNVDLRQVRGAVISGNTMWKGYTHNLLVSHCAQIVVSNNVFDRNPRYHYGDGSQARLGLVFEGSDDCSMTGNHMHGVGDISAALVLRRCHRMNVTGCSILDYGRCGILLEDVSASRVSDCMILDSNTTGARVALVSSGGRANMFVDNLVNAPLRVGNDMSVLRGNLQQ
ncbi:MAG: right-handed parallel beta-helix repeat-containing protein [Planctomycetaceae bacterium]